MKISYDMIDPELRMFGRIVALVIRPSEKSFRQINKTARLRNGAPIAGLKNDEQWIQSRRENETVRVRVYKPMQTQEPLPGVLYLHGGGYVMNTPEAEHATIKALIESSSCVVVAPDYCLSQQAPYPAALNDSYDTLLWMKEHHQELGIRPDQLIVIGGSAGGGLTAAVCLLARDEGKVRIAFQMPLYPMIDDRMTTASMIDNNAPCWNEQHNRLAWSLYLKGLDGDVPIYAAPARAEDLTGLPPAFTFVGSLDPFLDETVAYMEKLKIAGVPVEYRVFEGCFHGFEVVNPFAAISFEAKTFLLEKFAYGVEHYFAEQEKG